MTITPRTACAGFSVARRSASLISTRSVEPHCGFAASFNPYAISVGANSAVDCQLTLRANADGVAVKQSVIFRSTS